MEITQKDREFRPISIVLETEEEAATFFNMIRECGLRWAREPTQIKMCEQLITWLNKK